MASEYNAVQESIKIALDAADAATDVTSEYNKVKREHKKLEAAVKQVHRYTTIIFASSMAAALAALVFASLIYFRTLSDLTTMTTTSREALVVFAENVDTMNSSLDKLQTALETQQELVSLNQTLISELDNLRNTIQASNEAVLAGMKMTADELVASNDAMAKSIASGIAREVGSQTKKMVVQMSKLEEATTGSLNKMTKSMANNSALVSLGKSQEELVKKLDGLSGQNMAILNQFKTRDNRISYP